MARGLGAWAFMSVLVVGAGAGCTPQGDPAIPSSGFEDDFDRERIGDLWNNTGGPYRIRDGELNVRGAHNKPLWLERKLPHDVRITFDARSESQEGDIKVEVFGDGVSHAENESYTATSYVVILGGWNNSKNVIARMDEHGEGRVVKRSPKIKPGHTYDVKIERVDETLTVWLDGDELMKMKDSEPLYGRGHDHFAFNNWESNVFFDNLEITPL
jgi:hypothetical protein